MDIIQQLPLPEEICSKIFMFACKSPHTGIGVAMLKKKLKVNDLNIPENDKEITIFYSRNINVYPMNKHIHIYYCTCFSNLTNIDLNTTGITGNIDHMTSLPKLTNIYLNNTHVTGDIVCLKSLMNFPGIA